MFITGLAGCQRSTPERPAPESDPAASPAATTTKPAPLGCRLGDADGSRLWLDIEPDADVCAIDRFVFNNFLYFARPGSHAAPRLMELAPWYEAIPPNGSAPRWTDGVKPLSTMALRKTSREGQPGDSFELLDVARARVGYDVRVNRVFVDYLISSGAWQAQVLDELEAEFEADPSRGGVWLPSGSATEVGTISVKTSWRRFAEHECPQARMHCERDAHGHWWGLLGIHMVQKTPTLGEMSWASFEHVANAPDCEPGGSQPIAEAPADPTTPGARLPGGWNLFDYAAYRNAGGDGSRCAIPDGAYQYTVGADGSLQNQTCAPPASTPLCNTDPRAASIDDVEVDGFYRVNVCRTTPSPICRGDGSAADVVACLNADFARQFPTGLDPKWRYYVLVGSEYLDGHAPAVGCFRYDDGPTLTTDPPRSRFPSTCAGSDSTPRLTLAGNTTLANTTMETWMQDGLCLVAGPGTTPIMGRDCFACHAPATNPPGWPFGMGDMSFVFDRVVLPPG